VLPTQLNNGTWALSDPNYVAGVSKPLIVTVNKTDLSQSTQVTLQVKDVAGNLTNCDPVMVSVGRTPDLPRTIKTRVSGADNDVTIYNRRPGLQGLKIKVNKDSIEVEDLKPGEVRTIDLSKVMRP